MTKKRAMTTALIVGKIDFTKLRTELEEANLIEFEQCWYFDIMRRDARRNISFEPRNVEVYSTKPYNCRRTKSGHSFNQDVQKGVDNGIATKLLTLTLTDNIERIVFISGDGDFYSSLRQVRFEQKKEVWGVATRVTELYVHALDETYIREIAKDNA
ncbi:hypothetical protein PHMEG_00011209 [Phytophthora megakarya]|uniref:NYN domain-containing protein n=1 Tax=Phytophthora megakarya TaxID=4795 RepID=A0A225WBU6_9STRA|nr:hypothetical protein PHMEG_00011209 [Phytophthora megakarya]